MTIPKRDRAQLAHGLEIAAEHMRIQHVVWDGVDIPATRLLDILEKACLDMARQAREGATWPWEIELPGEKHE